MRMPLMPASALSEVTASRRHSGLAVFYQYRRYRTTSRAAQIRRGHDRRASLR
jgi:hypothetical protein